MILCLCVVKLCIIVCFEKKNIRFQCLHNIFTAQNAVLTLFSRNRFISVYDSGKGLLMKWGISRI